MGGLLAACAVCAEGVPSAFRHKVALIAGFGEGSEKAASVRRFAAAYTDSHGASFVFATKTRPGADRFRVLDAAGTVVYEGEDDREAEAAVVNALTDMPVPGQLINGVVLKKFKSYQKTFVMGKVKAEGSGLAPFKAALKSRKPAEVEEAQAILDSIAAAKKNLEMWIVDDLAERQGGRPAGPDVVLQDVAVREGEVRGRLQASVVRPRGRQGREGASRAAEEAPLKGRRRCHLIPSKNASPR